MLSCNVNNHFLINTISVVVQVILVFSFLVIFYFAYVVKIEEEDFKSQIDLLVNSFMKDIKNSKFVSLDQSNPYISNDDLKLLIYGILDTAQEKVKADTKSANDDIENNNKSLKKKAFNILYFALGALIVLLIFLRCLPISDIVKESITILLFVALTEFVFLSLISNKYISADPNKVKYALGSSIKDWLKKNKNIQ